MHFCIRVHPGTATHTHTHTHGRMHCSDVVCCSSIEKMRICRCEWSCWHDFIQGETIWWFHALLAAQPPKMLAAARGWEGSYFSAQRKLPAAIVQFPPFHISRAMPSSGSIQKAITLPVENHFQYAVCWRCHKRILKTGSLTRNKVSHEVKGAPLLLVSAPSWLPASLWKTLDSIFGCMDGAQCAEYCQTNQTPESLKARHTHTHIYLKKYIYVCVCVYEIDTILNDQWDNRSQGHL